MEGRELYRLLRALTSPVVAITTSAEGRRNGMIANSAQRASLVLSVPRVSMYISQTNFSHDLIYRSGIFGMHLLARDQWELIWRLGLRSGREMENKLEGVEIRIGEETGCPLLTGVRACFECRVANAMDAGAATFFLGDIVSVSEDRDGPVMESDYFRANMPEQKREIYLERLEHAQRELESIARPVAREQTWPGPVVGP